MNKAEVMRETERICRAIAKDFAEEKRRIKAIDYREYMARATRDRIEHLQWVATQQRIGKMEAERKAEIWRAIDRRTAEIQRERTIATQWRIKKIEADRIREIIARSNANLSKWRSGEYDELDALIDDEISTRKQATRKQADRRKATR